MRYLIAVAVLLAGCDAVETTENLVEELPTVQVTPEGPEVLPAGWFLHDYPAYCVMLARDEHAVARRCYDYAAIPAMNCTPVAAGGCRHFGL